MLLIGNIGVAKNTKGMRLTREIINDFLGTNAFLKMGGQKGQTNLTE